jgi:hypothetical protein
VLGIGDGSTGIGVLGVTNGGGSGGQADAIGVLALATSTTGTSTGLVAQISSPDGAAIEAQTSATGLIFSGNSDDQSSSNPKFVVTATGQVRANGGVFGKGFHLNNGNADLLENGDISTVGNISGASLTTSGDVTVGGMLHANGLSIPENLNVTTLTSSGNVTVGGTLNVSSINGGGLVMLGSLNTTGEVNVGANALVAGTVQVSTILQGGNAPLCTLSTAPNVIRFCSSSLRYKKNIQPFTSGMNVVNRLKPITFAWKEDGSQDMGLGAEDVAKVDKRLVFYNNKGEIEGVKYSQLNAVLINAIKQQQEQIDRQQSQIDALTRLVRRQGRRIANGHRR